MNSLTSETVIMIVFLIVLQINAVVVNWTKMTGYDPCAFSFYTIGIYCGTNSKSCDPH